MTTQACVGSSKERDPRAAAREAVGGALAGLAGEPDTLVVFATAEYDQARLLREVADASGGVPTSGCSGEGVIAGATSIESPYALSVLAVRSTSFAFEPFLLEDYARDPEGTGRRLGELASARDDLLGTLVFADGLHGNCTDFLRALAETGPAGRPVLGGTSADGMRFERTYQYRDAEPHSGAVAGLLVRGDGVFEVAVSHGCSPIGLERTVTRADGGWLHEIDGEPAWSVFQEYLADDPQDLNAEGIIHLCLGCRLEAGAAAGYDPYVIRTPLHLDKETGALFFPGGGLASGEKIRLTRRDPARISSGARSCAHVVLERHPGERPALALQFDCAGRGKVLFGSDASEEIVRPLQEELGTATPWAGFHSFGEIAPLGGRPYYHNYTVALCALYEPAGS